MDHMNHLYLKGGMLFLFLSFITLLLLFFKKLRLILGFGMNLFQLPWAPFQISTVNFLSITKLVFWFY